MNVTSLSPCDSDLLTPGTQVAVRFYEVPNMYLPIFSKNAEFPLPPLAVFWSTPGQQCIAQKDVSLLHLISRSLATFTQMRCHCGRNTCSNVELPPGPGCQKRVSEAPRLEKQKKQHTICCWAVHVAAVFFMPTLHILARLCAVPQK